MKRFGRIPRIWAATTIFLTAVLLFAGRPEAQTEPPVKVQVIFSKEVYNLDDPGEQISATIILKNNIPGSPVFTQEDFSKLWYDRYLMFQGPLPDGDLITSTSVTGGSSTTPRVEPEKVITEELPDGWRIKMDIDEVRDSLPLDKPGEYLAWTSMPFVQYDPAQVEAVDDNNDGVPDYYVVLPDAVLWNQHIESYRFPIILTTTTPYVTSDIRTRCTEYIFGEGSHPGVTKRPCSRLEIRLYERSAIENEAPDISPINHQTCGEIATRGSIDYKLFQPTPTPGEYLFEGAEQKDYIIIAYASSITDYKHLWSPISADDPNWDSGEISKNLILMTDKRGKKSPGKSKKLKGSELLIIEPEYVEWTSSEEVYSFALESLGDWDVEVALEPPEGFVTDHDSLSETVSSALGGVQFTVTDVGGKWKPTKIKYKVKHKGKTEKIKGEVKVKLSGKLAKEKGVSVWGEDVEPKPSKKKKKIRVK